MLNDDDWWGCERGSCTIRERGNLNTRYDQSVGTMTSRIKTKTTSNTKIKINKFTKQINK